MRRIIRRGLNFQINATTKTLTWKEALVENLAAVLAEAVKIAAEINT